MRTASMQAPGHGTCPCRCHAWGMHVTPMRQPLVSLRQFAASRSATPAHEHHRGQRTCVAAGGGQDLDFAVFRFTLGIPGFDDDNIPRVIGFLGAALLAVNHFVAGSAITPAQGRTEALGAVIAAVCIATPSVQARLKEMQQGALQAGSSGGGAFVLAPDLSETQRKELAWATYALLRNTNVSGVLVWRDGAVLAARGSLGASAGAADSQSALEAMAQAVEAAVTASEDLRQAATAASQPLYLPDAAALQQAGAGSWGFAPASAKSALAVSLAVDQSPVEAPDAAGRSVMLLFCDQPRGLSQRQRSWAAALAAKIGGACL